MGDSASRAEEIARLTRLRDAGALSDAEFSELKRQIIVGESRRSVWPFALAAAAALVVGAVVAVLVANQQGTEESSEFLLPTATAPPRQPVVPAQTTEPPAAAVDAAAGLTDEELEALRADIRSRVVDRLGGTFLGHASRLESEGVLWRTQNLLDEQMVRCAVERFHERRGKDIFQIIDRMIDELLPTETGTPSLVSYRVLTEIADRLRTEHQTTPRTPLTNLPLLSYVVLTCGGMDDARAREIAGL